MLWMPFILPLQKRISKSYTLSTIWNSSLYRYSLLSANSTLIPHSKAFFLSNSLTLSNITIIINEIDSIVT